MSVIEKGKNKEQNLQNAINGLKAFDEPPLKSYTLINEKLSPQKNPDYEQFLTKKGFTFDFPDTEKARDAALNFAKTLISLGYDAVVLRQKEFMGEEMHYMLHVGTRAAAQVAMQKKAEFSGENAILLVELRKEIKKNSYSSPLTEAVDLFFEKREPSLDVGVSKTVKTSPQKKEAAPAAKTYEEQKQKEEKGIAGIVPTAPGKQARATEKLPELEKELETKLAILRDNAETWGATGRSKIAQGYEVIQSSRSMLESEGLARRQDKATGGYTDLPLNDLFVGTPNKPGEIIRVENEIREVQKASAEARGIIDKIWAIDPVTGLALTDKLSELEKKIGDGVLSYQPSPIKVKTETGFDIYTRTEQKGKAIYAVSETEEAAEPKRGVVADLTRYESRLYSQGLDDSQPAYKAAREALLNNLAAEQLDAVMAYARGEREGFSLTIPKEKQKEALSAIRQLCNVNGFSAPAIDLQAPEGQIIVTGRAKAIPLSEEALVKIEQWDSGKKLTGDEKKLLAGRFSYQDISRMIDFIDRTRLAFSQGRKPQEYLSSEQGVFITKESIVDPQTVRALNGLFYYGGGIQVAYYESGGYLCTTIPTMYTEPEKPVFEFPKKISNRKPGEREKWLSMGRIPDREKQMETAINSGKGGEILFGTLMRENIANAKLLDIHRRNAEIVVGYLNSHGIQAKMAEFSEFDPKKKEDRNGIKIVIPENAMGIEEIKRKPNPIELEAAAPSPAEAAKIDPLSAIKNLPQNIATPAMKNAILSLVKGEKDGIIACRSEDQAAKMRNWLIKNGIPAEKLEIYATAPWEGEKRQVTSEFESTKVRDTKWMLRYSPEPVTRYPLAELETRGKKEPIHPNEKQEAQRLANWGKEQKAQLDAAAAEHEKNNPGLEVTVEYSGVGGTKRKGPTPDARATFQTEHNLGDAFPGFAYELVRRTEQDIPKAPAAGGYRRLREALEANLSAIAEDGKFRHADQFAMMMLREWRGAGRALAPDDKKAVADAWGVLERKYPTIEEFKKELAPAPEKAENAIKLEASANWLADRWLAQYNTKGMKAGEVEVLRNALKEVAWRTMIVVIQLEAGPAHYGSGPGKNRPQTPEEHFEGALLYMKNTEFKVKGEKEPYKTYFEYDGVEYNILSRRVLTAGPNPEHYVTIPSKEPGKVILYGKLRQKNVQLEDGRWIPAYSVQVLKPEERKVVGRDSLGEASFTPEFTGPIPNVEVRFETKERMKTIETETRLTIAPRIEADAVFFSAGMEIQWDKLYLRFLVPKEKVFAAMGGKPMMLENIVATSTTPGGEVFILPPRHRQDGKGKETETERDYFGPPGGRIYASAYVDKSGKVYAFMKKGEASPENARKHYKDTKEDLGDIEKLEIGYLNPKFGKKNEKGEPDNRYAVLADKYKAEYDKHIFGSRLVSKDELIEEGSTKNDRGETVDYRYRLKDADVGAHSDVVASGEDGDKAYVGTNIPFGTKEKKKVTFEVKE